MHLFRGDQRAPLRPAFAVQCHRHSQQHEAHRGVEHEPRLPMIHDRATEHRANGAADVEACRDNAKHPAGHHTWANVCIRVTARRPGTTAMGRNPSVVRLLTNDRLRRETGGVGQMADAPMMYFSVRNTRLQPPRAHPSRGGAGPLDAGVGVRAGGRERGRAAQLGEAMRHRPAGRGPARRVR